jgi:hypothetical protein
VDEVVGVTDLPQDPHPHTDIGLAPHEDNIVIIVPSGDA